MWFDYAYGKEKIIHMFNNELSLSGVEFDKLIYHDVSRLTIFFNSRKLPSVMPKKWIETTFNSLSISLTFTEVLALKIDGGRMGFECTPIVDLVNGSTRFIIENEGFEFLCISNFMFIDNIVPYLDDRWVG
ncbi:Imm50 family immunity protein [Rahnella inusitata]|uniref:Imm50 family immunity protein n=1 Tax=Rahnella inusitata TaxID=58169 RepID=UPI0039AF29A0